nr:hypothetical protein [Pseudonocardia sp. Ae717_Ps2]
MSIATIVAGDQLDAAADVDEPGDDGADGDHLAVCEVREAGGAEDQRQADRGDADDQAEPDAVDEQPQEGREPAGGGALDLGAEAEHHGVQRSGGHLAGGLALQDLGAGRQRGLVEPEQVGTGAGDGQGPAAVRLGAGLTGWRTVALGGDAHVRQRLAVLVPQRAADVDAVRLLERGDGAGGGRCGVGGSGRGGGRPGQGERAQQGDEQAHQPPGGRGDRGVPRRTDGRGDRAVGARSARERMW